MPGTQSSSIGNGWGLLESSTGEFKAMTEGGFSAPLALPPGFLWGSIGWGWTRMGCHKCFWQYHFCRGYIKGFGHRPRSDFLTALCFNFSRAVFEHINWTSFTSQAFFSQDYTCWRNHALLSWMWTFKAKLDTKPNIFPCCQSEGNWQEERPKMQT